MTLGVPTAQSGDTIGCTIGESFADWMSRCNGCIAVSTYQAGKVALIGWNGQQVTFLPRNFDKPLGMCARGNSLALATRNHLILLANAPLLAPDYLIDQPGKYDALFVPRCSYHTGDLNIHDIVYTTDDLWIVNTRFCCLGKLSSDFSFIPHWKPPFVSEIVPEDRCHLNGLAVVDNLPKYVTCLGTTDARGAWRENKANGGVIIDVPTNQIIATGLCMPHSPRWYNNQLYVLNSGAGELCAIDLATWKHTVVCGLPGYLRGLSFTGPYALVGLSQIREKHTFGGLPVQQRNPRLRCAIAIIDLRTGQTAGMFEFSSGCQELYDVLFLPGIQRPMILNLEKEAERHAFVAPGFSCWYWPVALNQPLPSDATHSGR